MCKLLATLLKYNCTLQDSLQSNIFAATQKYLQLHFAIGEDYLQTRLFTWIALHITSFSYLLVFIAPNIALIAKMLPLKTFRNILHNKNITYNIKTEYFSCEEF